MTKWPPDGYSPPSEYTRSEIVPAIIAIILFLVIYGVTFEYIYKLYSTLLDISIQFIGGLGIGGKGLIIGLGISSCFLILMGIAALIVPVHESIHYVIGCVLGYSPKLILSEFMGVKNPAVIVPGKGLRPMKQLPITTGPFIIIGLISLIGVAFTNGASRGVFSWILLMNSVISSADIMTAIDLIRFPSGTLLANIQAEDGSFYTEVAHPKDSPSPDDLQN